MQGRALLSQDPNTVDFALALLVMDFSKIKILFPSQSNMAISASNF